MTDAEQDQLRRELPRLTARLATAARTLLDLTIFASVRGRVFTDWVKAQDETRKSLADFNAWVRRAAGPEDLAGLRPPDAAKREDAEVR